MLHQRKIVIGAVRFGCVEARLRSVVVTARLGSTVERSRSEAVRFRFVDIKSQIVN